VNNRKYYQVNHYIKVPELRVIGLDGSQLGVMKTSEALARAQEDGVDLVVVTEKAVPPVAKIIDFQKFKYQQNKKEKAGAVKQKASDTKEVRFTPFIAQNDFDIRIEKSKEFLAGGYRVKVVVKFTGRQMARREFGVQLVNRAVTALSEVAKIDQEPKWQGKMYFVQLKPVIAKK
jgi:translation initiation factor IF-3